MALQLAEIFCIHKEDGDSDSGTKVMTCETPTHRHFIFTKNHFRLWYDRTRATKADPT